MSEADGGSERLIGALSELGEVAAAVPPGSALESFDTTTREVFFREWPGIRSWSESFWQRLHNELGEASLPDDNPKSPETGVGD